MKTFKTDFDQSLIPSCPQCAKQLELLPIYLRTRNNKTLIELLLICDDDFLLHRQQFGDDATLKIWSYSWSGVRVGNSVTFCDSVCLQRYTESAYREFCQSWFTLPTIDSAANCPTVARPRNATQSPYTAETAALIHKLDKHRLIWSFT